MAVPTEWRRARCARRLGGKCAAPGGADSEAAAAAAAGPQPPRPVTGTATSSRPLPQCTSARRVTNPGATISTPGCQWPAPAMTSDSRRALPMGNSDSRPRGLQTRRWHCAGRLGAGPGAATWGPELRLKLLLATVAPWAGARAGQYAPGGPQAQAVLNRLGPSDGPGPAALSVSPQPFDSPLRFQSEPAVVNPLRRPHWQRRRPTGWATGATIPFPDLVRVAFFADRHDQSDLHVLRKLHNSAALPIGVASARAIDEVRVARLKEPIIRRNRESAAGSMARSTKWRQCRRAKSPSCGSRMALVSVGGVGTVAAIQAAASMQIDAHDRMGERRRRRPRPAGQSQDKRNTCQNQQAGRPPHSSAQNVGCCLSTLD